MFEIYVDVIPMTNGQKLYEARCFFEEEKVLIIETRESLRKLFVLIKEYYREDWKKAVISGEFFEDDLTEDDVKVWETPLKEIIPS